MQVVWGGTGRGVNCHIPVWGREKVENRSRRSPGKGRGGSWVNRTLEPYCQSKAAGGFGLLVRRRVRRTLGEKGRVKLNESKAHNARSGRAFCGGRARQTFDE